MEKASTVPPSNELKMLDPAAWRITRERAGWLLLHQPGLDEVRVKAVRTFPLTDPDHYVSLLDEEELEVGIVENPSELDAESREALDSYLDQNYFLPVIQKIRMIAEEFGVYSWDVETNKGDRAFEVRGRDDVRIVANGHVLVRDIDGNRYHIQSLNRLDPESRLRIDLLL